MELEGGVYDNRTISRIIDLSLGNRILSNYTAFLALEPGIDLDRLLQNVENGEQRCVTCDDCFDCFGAPVPEVLTSVDEEVDVQEVVKVFPNPFSESLSIQAMVPNHAPLGRSLSWTLYDAVGKKLLQESLTVQNREVTLFWDGTEESGNAVPTGVYFVKIAYGDKVWIRRVVKE